MASELIQFRLSGEALEALQSMVGDGESLNLAAQRLMKQLLESPVAPVSTPYTEDVVQIVESIIEEKFNCLQQRIQEEVQAEVKKLSGNLVDADVDALQKSVYRLQESVDTLQKERDQLDARNLELEAEIEQLQLSLGKSSETPERLTKEEAERILSALGVGKQSPQFRRVASVLKGLLRIN